MPKTNYPNDHNDDTDVVYTDVVIVGNGPGAICLSYMLAGNWPYYTGEPHPGDAMLTARLNYVTRNIGGTLREPELNNENLKSPYGPNTRRCKIMTKKMGKEVSCLARSSRNNLSTLVSGLEGRGGGKPLAQLMDQLQHPCVDIGLNLPSLLTWLTPERNPDHRIIDHVVLGKGPPGGSWQSMDPDVLTISLSRWMSLPNLHLKKWCKLREAENIHKSMIITDQIGNIRRKRDQELTCKAASRVPVGTVAAYYEDYVRTQGLSKYFKWRTVTSVRPIQGLRDSVDEYGWLVVGYENDTGKRFVYRAKRVVLASGTTDAPNRLDLPAEQSLPDWITHDLNDLEDKLDQLANDQLNYSLIEIHETPTNREIDPILVVGAGLSAADAIMAARFRGIPVIHVFRDTSGDRSRKKTDTEEPGFKIGTSNYEKLQWLPASIYPEYHKVYEMMADRDTSHPLYRALPDYSLVDLGSNDSEHFQSSEDRKVTLCSPNGQLQTLRVSTVAILIGSKPDLSYLGEYATRLGKIVNKPIDSKLNPIEADDFTYEVSRSPRSGLYALGPLVGDNFVRFLLGGALGIIAHILNTSGT